MSVSISLSNNFNNFNHCNEIIKKLMKYNINCRTIETKSIVDNNIEHGCLVTIGDKYNSKREVKKVWQIINSHDDYTCAHLNINGTFDGCILNYINAYYCK